MKKAMLAAAAALGFAVPASAGIITLGGITQNGAEDFTFTYQGTLGPDEGLRAGDRLIIFDFRGYIDGSISADGNANVVVSVENTSPDAIVTPGFDDDPNIVNLVFTYNGPDFRSVDGPFEPFDFDGLLARSRFGGIGVDAFYGLSTKNNPDDVPGGSDTVVISLGQVSVPALAIPEPSSWAMMLAGFGLLGAATRRRSKASRVTS
jgi:hypothetical protein